MAEGSLNQIKNTFKKFTELTIQSYAILIITIIAVLLSFFNKNLGKQVPVVLIVNALISVYVVECLVRGDCTTLSWIFVVFNCLLILGLAGIFQTDLSFNINTLLINKSK
jgi:glucan phosphoethanolaminetransferase (alkaline phosphatase superfamily)